MVQTAETDFPINSNTTSLKYKLMLKLLDIFKIYYMIQRLNSYSPLKKSLEQFTDQMKKAKKVPQSW